MPAFTGDSRGLPIAAAVLTVFGLLVANLLARVAWLLVDPNRPTGRPHEC